MSTLKQKQSYLLVTLAFLAIHCATPMGLAQSNIPLDGRQIKSNLGAAEGSASSWGISLFCLTDWSVPDIDLAIRRAIESKGGNALISVRWYTKDTCLILANFAKVVVTGDVVDLAPFSSGRKR